MFLYFHKGWGDLINQTQQLYYKVPYQNQKSNKPKLQYFVDPKSVTSYNSEMSHVFYNNCSVYCNSFFANKIQKRLSVDCFVNNQIFIYR